MITKKMLIEAFDLIDGKLVRKKNAGPAKAGTYSLCTDREGYRVVGFKGKNHREHRLIWLYVHGHLPDKDIDHINGIKDDNRPENLRTLSRSENKQNQSAQSNNKTGFKGVMKHKDKFIANICLEGKNYYLGLHETPEKAYESYKTAASMLHKYNRVSDSKK